MRRYEKRRLLEQTKTLKRAIESVKRGISANAIWEMNEVLVACQQTAMEIGEYIEQREGEGTETIRLLEEYCENIYQLSVNWRNEKTKQKLIIENKDILRKIANSIKYDLLDSKKEIVFLSYKASMWDSFESVWEAATSDKECDCYVIPIPYFDKKLDGSLGEIHYEGNLYPEYVPITSWQEYDICEHHPDVIYIHNPYDQYNRVTTVHPKFYSTELRKNTDMLVYIPYFIAVDDKVTEHFCVIPGVLYSHKVVVQSEKVRQTYINELRKFEEEGNCKDFFGKIEDKIIALGSPKFDSLYRAQRNSLDIPSSWCEKMKKTDGTLKKIILYNTSVQALLTESEGYLNKIEDVLKVFWDNREEITLLWRPHPLNAATMSALRPELLERYKKIVEEYKKANYGIFDDTAELHRSIALSDAYYGDGGSLLALFVEAKKPAMRQNVRVLDKNISNVWWEDMCIFEGRAYFAANNINGIFCMDLDTMKIEQCDVFETERNDVNRLFSAVKIFGSKMLFVPLYADNIYIYDLTKNSKERILFEKKMNKNRVSYENTLHFIGAILYGKYIYLIPHRYPAIVRYDIETGELNYYDDWLEEIERHIIDSSDVYFRKDYVVKGKYAYLPSCNANVVLKLNLEEATTQVIVIGGVQEGFSSIQLVDNDLWLVARRSNKIYIYNEKEGMVDNIECGNAFHNSGFRYISSCRCDNKIFLFPGVEGEAIVVVDINDKTSLDLDIEEDNAIKQKRFSYSFNYVYVGKVKDDLYIVDMKNEELVIYDLQSKTIRKIRMHYQLNCKSMNGQVFAKRMTKFLADKEFKIENLNVSLTDYLLYINQLPEGRNRHSKDLIGKKIHEVIKENVKEVIT